jgi:hypothetical protein
VAETSSTRGAITVEEVMELVTCRYIDFPGVGVINLEAPQLPEKVLEVATERMFAELTIMEAIVSISKVSHEYERAGGFTPSAEADDADAALDRPWPVRSQLQMRPRHRQPARVGRRPSPSRRKLPKP